MISMRWGAQGGPQFICPSLIHMPFPATPTESLPSTDGSGRVLGTPFHPPPMQPTPSSCGVSLQQLPAPSVPSPGFAPCPQPVPSRLGCCKCILVDSIIPTHSSQNHLLKISISSCDLSHRRLCLTEHHTPIRTAKIQNTDSTGCWRGCGAIRTQIYCWWEYKMAQSLWKSLAVT